MMLSIPRTRGIPEEPTNSKVITHLLHLNIVVHRERPIRIQMVSGDDGITALKSMRSDTHDLVILIFDKIKSFVLV